MRKSIILILIFTIQVILSFGQKTDKSNETSQKSIQPSITETEKWFIDRLNDYTIDCKSLDNYITNAKFSLDNRWLTFTRSFHYFIDSAIVYSTRYDCTESYRILIKDITRIVLQKSPNFYSKEQSVIYFDFSLKENIAKHELLCPKIGPNGILDYNAGGFWSGFRIDAEANLEKRFNAALKRMQEYYYKSQAF